MSEDCRELERLLGASRGDPRQAELVVERHLEDCPRCRGQLTGGDWVARELARLPRLSGPPWLARRILARTGAVHARRPSTTGDWRRLFGLAAGLAAAALLLLSLSPWSLRRQSAYSREQIEAARQQAHLSLGYTGRLIDDAQRTALSLVVERQIGERLDASVAAALRSGLERNKGGS